MQVALDWDGTCTVSDSLVAAIRVFGDPSVSGRDFASHGEGLVHEVGTLRASAEEVSAWAVEHVELRAGFRELVERFSPVIVSSGLPQLIEPVLAREGIGVEVRSNTAEPRLDGWALRFYDERLCPVCGEHCKRTMLPEGRPLVYVGDGYSDRCAALACDRVFARDFLARFLAGEGVEFEPFETLGDVAAALAA
jgi:2-hydroxy-3-keto-5-methylthiopentenyl-1-phosphate phosphatase